MKLRHSLFALFGMAITMPVAAQAASQPYHITYIEGVTGNPFYISVGCGAAAEAKQLGVSFNVQGPQSYQAQLQTQIIDATVAAHPNGIMVSEDDPTAVVPSLMQAKQADIKVLMIDGDPKAMSLPISNVQSNDYKGGQMAADLLAKAIGSGGGDVMALMNTPAAFVPHQRLEGFINGLKNHPNLTYIGVQYSQNQVAHAAQAVSSMAAAHPTLAGVFAITTNNTEGAVTGIRDAQRLGKIKVVGFDTSDPIVEDIRNGLVAFDVVQAPYEIGELGLQTMVDALNGKQVPREQYRPFVVATPQNVDTAEVKKFIYVTRCSG